MLVLKLCQQYCPDKIPYSPTHRLGDGADGEVFEIKESLNQVIKFCVLYEREDQDLLKTYTRITSVLSHLKGEPVNTYAHVYEHQYLGTYQRQTFNGQSQKYILYYYVMEKLNKLSEDERKVFHSILCHEDRNIVKDFSLPKVKEMLRGLHRALDFDVDRVIFFYDNFRKTSVVHHDLHVRNIMKDSTGDFKLIDFDRAQIMEVNDG